MLEEKPMSQSYQSFPLLVSYINNDSTLRNYPEGKHSWTPRLKEDIRAGWLGHWVGILSPLLTSCVTLGKLFNIFVK